MSKHDKIVKVRNHYDCVTWKSGIKMCSKQKIAQGNLPQKDWTIVSYSWKQYLDSIHPKFQIHHTYEPQKFLECMLAFLKPFERSNNVHRNVKNMMFLVFFLFL